MLVPVYDHKGEQIIGHIEREGAECGKDFCDECGDCIHCYGEDECPSGYGHRWLYYVSCLDDEDLPKIIYLNL